MNRGIVAALIFFAGTTVFCAEDKKASLDAARMQYQLAVHQHGPRSPEAKTARKNLRQTRKNFHTGRRHQAHPTQSPQ